MTALKHQLAAFMMGAASFKFLVADHILLCFSESEQQFVTRGSFNMNKVEL